VKSSEPRFRSTRKVWVLVLTMLAVSLTLVACDLAPSVTPVATTATIPSVPPTSIPSPLDLTSCNINISVKIPGPLSDTELQESRQQCLQSLDRNIQKWKAKNVAGYDITVFYQGTFNPTKFIVIPSKIVRLFSKTLKEGNAPVVRPLPRNLSR